MVEDANGVGGPQKENQIPQLRTQKKTNLEHKKNNVFREKVADKWQKSLKAFIS